jgi:hypothetical protein
MASLGSLITEIERLQARVDDMRQKASQHDAAELVESLSLILGATRLQAFAVKKDKSRDRSLESPDCVPSVAAGTPFQKIAAHCGACEYVDSVEWLQDADTPKRKFRKTPIRPNLSVHHGAPARNDDSDTEDAAPAATARLLPIPISELPVWRCPSDVALERRNKVDADQEIQGEEWVELIDRPRRVFRKTPIRPEA